MAREVLAGPTLDAARALVGTRLVREPDGPARERRVGRIVEVEGYIGTDDLASHARFGRTGRNGVMFGGPGVAYVYLVYGMYDCLNVVTEPDGRAGAVLIRAVEPIDGIAEMRSARLRHTLRPRRAMVEPGTAAARLGRIADDQLAMGPGVLTAAFDIDRSHTGLDLLDPASPLRIEVAAGELPTVAAGRRIGIDYAPEPWRSRPWRFFDAASPSVSRPRPDVPRPAP